MNFAPLCSCCSTSASTPLLTMNSHQSHSAFLREGGGLEPGSLVPMVTPRDDALQLDRQLVYQNFPRGEFIYHLLHEGVLHGVLLDDLEMLHLRLHAVLLNELLCVVLRHGFHLGAIQRLPTVSFPSYKEAWNSFSFSTSSSP